MMKLLPPFLAPAIQNLRISKPWRDWFNWVYDRIGELDAAIAAVSGGSPGGATTQVQYNDAGAFAGDADLTWDKTTNKLQVTGLLGLTGSLEFGQANTVARTTVASSGTNLILAPNSGGTSARSVVSTLSTRVSTPELHTGIDSGASAAWLWSTHTGGGACYPINVYVGSSTAPQVQFTNTVATPVNYLTLGGSATGNAVNIGCGGSDTNINIAYTAKGTGSHVLTNISNVPIVDIGDSNVNNQACALRIGPYRFGSGDSYIDFIADTTYSVAAGTAGFSIRRYAGVNSVTSMSHRGTGSFQLIAQEGDVKVYAGNGLQFRCAAQSNTINSLYTIGAVTTKEPVLGVEGTDANISMQLQPKGTGNINVQRGTGTVPSVIDTSTYFRVNGDDASSVRLEVNSYSNGGASPAVPLITFRRAGGIGSNPFSTATAASDVFGSVRGVGNTTSGYTGNVAVIDYVATENFTTTALGTKIDLKATGTGTTTSATQLSVVAPPSATSVNYVTARGSATGVPVRLASDGSDTNIDLLINPKGTGNIVVPKASGFGIKVDPTTPTYGWADMIGNVYIKTTGAGSPLLASYAGAGAIQQFQFALNDAAYFEFHIPHDYVPGTDIYAHVHWSCNTSTITTGSVTWEFSTSYAKGHDQAAFAAPLVTTIAQNASTVQRRHMIAETVITTSGGSATLHDTSLIEIDGLFLMRLKLTANSISTATDPFVHFVDLHYQTTGVMGTKQKAPNFYT